MAEVKHIKNKIRILFLFLFLFCALLIASSFRWTIIEGSTLRDIADGRVLSSELTSLRGSIYAKDGSTLAYSEPRFDMFIWMNDLEFFESEKIDIQTREEFLQKVAPIIDKTPEELEQTINEFDNAGIKWIPIARNLTSTQWEDLRNLKTDKDPNRYLTGFVFEYTSQRIYPEGQLASHIIGLTTRDNDDTEFGISGLESAWNGDLNPRKGIIQREENAVGDTLATALIETIEPRQGSSIYTSIDKRLQLIAEDKTSWAVDHFEADSASIIIIEPRTGEVLALANYPTYNPNERDKIDNPLVFGNSSISAPYEVGSIVKTLTLATAIDNGTATPQDIIMPNGHEGCEVVVEDLPPVCTFNKLPQPPMPLNECFIKSDNLCFYHLSQKIGANKSELGIEVYSSQNMHNYFTNFGIGVASGIDLGGESFGLFKSVGTWDPTDVATFSYGHGFQMNAIQALSSIATIANNGVRMKPHIVTNVTKGDGNEIVQQPVALNRVISGESANIVASMMQDVFQSSIRSYEGPYLDLLNYQIGYKSGTALIVENGVYTADIFATHVGCDFSEDRKFCMLVKIEKPRSVQRLSFYNSRVLFLETLIAMKDYLNLERVD